MTPLVPSNSQHKAQGGEISCVIDYLRSNTVAPARVTQLGHTCDNRSLPQLHKQGVPRQRGVNHLSVHQSPLHSTAKTPLRDRYVLKKSLCQSVSFFLSFLSFLRGGRGVCLLNNSGGKYIYSSTVFKYNI